MEQIIVTHVDNTTLKLQSKENRSSVTKFTQNVELLGADAIDISVESATKLSFYIGDKITVIGRDYTLNTPPVEKKYSEKSFTYDLQFEGVQYDLMRAAFSVNVDTTSNQIQDLNGEALTGDLKMFLDVLISNVNRVFPNKWVLGTYPQNTETRNEVFGETDNCLSVLQSLCGEDKYNTEFSIAIGENGVRTLNVGATGNVFPFTFEYGRGKGIYELTRERISSSNIITRLNVFGSSKNIITTKYRASRLCLPTKSKSQSYLEDASAIAKFGVWENTKIFDDIYPHRTGTISAVDDHLTFADSSMDFDLNAKDGEGNTLYLISGTSAKVSIKTGNLAGYEFELTSYDHATKKFKVKQQIDENGYKFPSADTAAFQFAIGDEYTITDIYLPQSYVDTAEAALQTAGQSYLDKYKAPNVQYSISEIDPFFLSRIVGAEVQSNIIWVGDYIPVKDTDLDIDKSLRVKSFTRDLLKDYSYSISVAENAVSVTMITRIISDLNGIDNIVSINNLKDPARARRNYKATSELVTMIDVVKAEAVLIGNDPASQYSLTGVAIRSNYQSNPNSIHFTAGSIAHNYYPVGSPGIWNITAGTFADLTSVTAYYAYIKASKSENTATYYLSSSKIEVESVFGFFHFPLGILSSVIDGARVFTTTKGYTLITGDSIRTGKVTSSDGLTYFDLDSGVIQGKITFMSGSSGYSNLTDKPDLSVYSLQSDVNAIVSNLQAQIDGQIMTWFDTYVPSLANAPATSWSTDAEKDKHLGDLFYNKSTGLGYRFSKTGSVYSWELLKDTDVALALANAAAAQDTADGKRRVFVAQPTTPYEVGDLWTQGATGDLMKCKVERLTGSYSSSDWEKAAKYTDDTAAINATYMAQSCQYGKMLYRDPTFKYGLNGMSRYNNYGVIEPYVDRVEAPADSPNGGGYVVRILREDMGNEVGPGHGGFYFATRCRANATLITRLVAKIPIGYTINFGSNAIGSNADYRWLTSPDGSGRYQEYLFYLKCGDSGVFETTNFFYLTGPNQGHSWYISFATVYDLTDSDIPTIDSKSRHFITTPTTPYYVGDTYTDGIKLYRCKAQRLTGSYSTADWELATTFDNTKTVIEGGLITSGTMQVGSETYGGINVKAGITGQGSADDSVRLWAGAPFVNRWNAPFRVNQRGDMVATAGSIAGWEILSGQIRRVDGDYEVQVSSEEKAIRFRYQGDDKILLTAGALPALSSLISPTSGTINPTNKVATFTGDGTYSKVSGTFTIPDSDVSLMMYFGQTPQFTASYWINCNVYLGNASGQKLMLIGNVNRFVRYGVETTNSMPFSAVAGTYTLIYEWVITSATGLTEGTFYPITFAYTSQRQGTIMGSNGIANYWSADKFFYMNQNADHFLALRGSTNIPGVLAAASVASAGGSSNKWGAKVGDSTNSSTGTYVISHTIGHNNYSVQITGRSGARIGYVSAKGANSLTIVMTNMSGSAVNSDFDYCIVGNN